MKYLVTGATGFVGKALVNELTQTDNEVRILVRKPPQKLADSVTPFIGEFPNPILPSPIAVNFYDLYRNGIHFSSSPSQTVRSLLLPKINKTTSNTLKLVHTLREALQDIEAVIHTAARVHIMNEKNHNPLDAFRNLNRDATLLLAKMAAEAGVKRFVFLSSIKVNGEHTLPGQPFKADDTPRPEDPYGISKFEAERALLELTQHTDMEVVIIRPPLIYGPNVKANFSKMMSWVKRGIPLPLGSVNNARSLVALDNLVDLIILCANPILSPKAKNEIFLVSDEHPVSTTHLLKNIAQAYTQKAHLFKVPPKLICFIAKLIGKQAITDRLFGNLEVDINKTHQLLGWTPKSSMMEQLEKIVKSEQAELTNPKHK